MSIDTVNPELLNDAYLWLTNTDPFDIDLKGEVSRFVQDKGIHKSQTAKVQAAFQKALKAYQMVAIGNAARKRRVIRLPGTIAGSHHMIRNAALKVFDSRVGQDREVIMPSTADIEFFSSRHSEVFQIAESYSEGLELLSDVYEQNPRRFIFAHSLLNLQNDPRVSGRSVQQIWDLITAQYPALIDPNVQDPDLTRQRFFARAAQGMPWIEALIGAYDNQREIRTDFAIAISLFQLAHKDPEEVSNWIFFVQKNQKHIFQFYEFFNEFTDAELNSALRHLRDEGIKDPDDRLIALANKLYVIFPQMYLPNDSTIFACFSPTQGAIIQKRAELIHLGSKHLHEKYRQIFKKGLQGHPYSIESVMRAFIEGPKQQFGPFEITEQFRKDHVRYDEVIVADRLATPMSYPGNRTLAQAGQPLLANLAQLATTDDELDQRLFFMLQEATSQNLKIRSFQHWLLRKIQHDIGAMPNTLVMLNPNKDCTVIEKLSDTRIDCMYDFRVKLSNPHDESSELYNARITIPIIKVKDRWVYGQPQWMPLVAGAPSLQALYQPTPLAALPPVAHPPVAAVQAMLQAGDGIDQESDDEDNFILPSSAQEAPKIVLDAQKKPSKAESSALPASRKSRFNIFFWRK